MKLNDITKYIIFLGYKIHLFDKMDDEKYLRLFYYCLMGKKLNLDDPQTFNEKLQWLKLYNRKPEYSKMVDKYEAKKYVADIIGEEYIIPTLGVYDSFDEIDFDALPEQFVIKCTHDSGGVAICKSKADFDIESARNKINKSLANNYYKYGRELVYKDVRHRLIVEEYMQDGNNDDLLDYKFMCFNSVVKCSFICLDRYTDSGLKVDFYDRNWNKMPFIRKYPCSDVFTPKPINYDKMIEFAELLSKEIPFVRVDFYEINGKLYFGEMTFFPGSGTEPFYPEEWDKTFGDWIKLPEKTGE